MTFPPDSDANAELMRQATRSLAHTDHADLAAHDANSRIAWHDENPVGRALPGRAVSLDAEPSSQSAPPGIR